MLHNDDTTVKILELMGERGRQEARADAEGDADERRGLFTTGVVALRDGRRVALFFSGRRHAGENLAQVLKHPPRSCRRRSRCATRCRATCRALQTIPGALPWPTRGGGSSMSTTASPRCAATCSNRWPWFIATMRSAAGTSAIAGGASATPSGGERADDAALHDWLERQLGEKRAEPTSGLGGAIGYTLKHWEKLTLFLRQAGAPLDNNLCERALKKAILHRKNALFYKTQNGAKVGDLFMSLIYTCQLNEANPFDYLTELQQHPDELAAPEQWMPWNRREVLT